MRIGKKIISLTLAIAMALPLVAECNSVPDSIKAAETSIKYGDVNSDGKINIFDMISLKSYLIEKNSNKFSVRAADVDDDQTISAKDVVELSMFLLGKVNTFSPEKYIDTDEDGLCDYIEKEVLKTKYDVKDTDGDELDDYTEVYITGTDPLIPDTGKTGVKDSLRDDDGDGITNKDEIELGTSCALKDTDADGLSDLFEISVNSTDNKYKTNPLKSDSDSDGISDSGELLLGLNPLVKKSDGNTLDSERMYSQKLDEKYLYAFNSLEPNYDLSISAKSSGYIGEAVTVTKSKYAEFLREDEMLGEIIDIDYSDKFKIENLQVRFQLQNVSNPNDYMVFKYVEESCILLPALTNYDGNTIYVDDVKDGTYCVVCTKDLSGFISEYDNADINSSDANNFLEGDSNVSQCDANNYLEDDSNVSQSDVNNILDDTVKAAPKSKEFSFNIYVNENFKVNSWENVKATISETAEQLTKLGYVPIIHIYFTVNTGRYGYYSVSVACSNISSLNQILKTCDNYFQKSITADNAESEYYKTIAGSTVKWPNPVPSNPNNFRSSNYGGIIFAFGPDLLFGKNCKISTTGISCYVVGERILNFKNIYYDIIRKNINKNTSDTICQILMYADDKIAYPTSFFGGILMLTRLSANMISSLRNQNLSREQKIAMGCLDTDGDGILDVDELNLGLYTVVGDKFFPPKVRDAYKYQPITEGGVKKLEKTTGEIADSYYHPQISKVNSSDSNNNGIDDSVDKVPNKDDLACICDKLKQMESIIDEFLEPVKTEKGPNEQVSQIEANIIRSINYSGLKWKITSGSCNSDVADYINRVDPSIIKYFKNNRYQEINSDIIDFWHMMATLSGYWSDTLASGVLIDKDLAGWAGDLQSLIYDLIVTFYPNTVGINDVAYSLMGASDTNFSSEDVIADIDAKNMSTLYSENDPDLNNQYLSMMVKDYYSKQYRNRYTHFVNSYGGIEKLENLCDDFTYGDEIVKHRILKSSAKNAANNNRVFDLYVQSSDDDIKLPHPAKITKEEGKALTYAFVRYIRERAEKE